MTLFLGGVLFTAFMKVMYVGMYAFMGTSAVEKLEQVFSDMQKDRLIFETRAHSKTMTLNLNGYALGIQTRWCWRMLASPERRKELCSGGIFWRRKVHDCQIDFWFLQSGWRSGQDWGESIEAYTEDALIRNIAFVFQNVRLFRISIYENVRLANPDAQRTEVMEALHQAGCDSILDKFKDRGKYGDWLQRRIPVGR